jgi:hypothetical protein
LSGQIVPDQIASLPARVVAYRASAAYAVEEQEPSTLPTSARNELRERTIALATATAEIRLTGGPGGIQMAPGNMLPGATVLYGRLGNGSRNILYRSTDGNTWVAVHTDAGAVNHVWIMPDDTVLFTSNAAGNYLRRGVWDGSTLTVSNTACTGVSQHSQLAARDHLFVTTTGATIYMEYPAASTVGARIWRSPNYGASAFTAVFTNTGVAGHFHGGGQLAATGRLIVSEGDTTSIAQLYSDDDGASWNYLAGFERGTSTWRPVGFLDTGDVTRLLIGDDGPAQVSWFRPSDGTIEPLLTTLPRSSSCGFVWSMHYAGGIYYACRHNSTGTPTGVPNVGLHVSTDLEHWACCYQLPPTYHGFNYAGTLGGNLHFAIQIAADNWAHMVVSGVTCAIIDGARLEPSSTNLLTANQASMETDVSGWTTVSGTTLTSRTTSGCVGNKCLALTAPSTGTRGAYVTKTGLTVGQNLIGSVRVRCSASVSPQCKLTVNVRKGSTVTRTVVQYFQAGPEWQRVTTPCIQMMNTSPAEDRFDMMISQDQAGYVWGSADLEIDAAGLWAFPGGAYVGGGETRASDCVRIPFYAPTAWSLVAAIAPEFASPQFSAWVAATDAGAVTTGEHEILRIESANDPTTYVRVFFDTADAKIKLSHVVSGSAEGLGIETTALHWPRLGPVYVAVRRSNTTLSLSVNTMAGAIHSAAETTDDTTLRLRDVAVRYAGDGSMPLTIGALRMYPEALSDLNVAAAMLACASGDSWKMEVI